MNVSVDAHTPSAESPRTPPPQVPLERAGYLEAAHHLSNPFVVDRQSGEWIDLDTFLGNGDYGQVVAEKRVRLRIEMLDGVVRYVCPRCQEPMTLASVPVRTRDSTRFYFKHAHETGKCNGVAGLGERAICALKFNHQKEGRDHVRFKERLLDSLSADPSFAQTKAETRFVDVGGVRWRQPDVQSKADGRTIAFEVQLSTTFLHVIAERMRFYARNEAALVWLFRDLNVSDFRQAEDDIFYANNRNAFRLTEETVVRSKERQRFALECAWLEPKIQGGLVRDVEQRAVIDFCDLHFDVSSVGVPRAFYFDYDAARARAEKIVDGFDLRQRFETHWLAGAEDHDEWLALRTEFRGRRIELPEWPKSLDGFPQLLNMLYSVKHWRAIGYRYKSLVEIAHHLHDRRKGFLWLFHHSLDAYGRVDAFKQMDIGPNCYGAKVERYRGVLLTNPQYAFDGKYVDLAQFLFPELPEKAFHRGIREREATAH